MFKALMGGGRSSSDGRSTTSSSSKGSRRKTDSKSTSSRKSSRGDDRDRGLGDLSTYPPPSSGSRRGPSSAADDVVTAEPDSIEAEGPVIIERVPKRRDSDRGSTRPHRSTADELDDESYRGRRRAQPRDPDVTPISISMPSSAPGAQFATDNNAPGFSQFPIQHVNVAPPASSAPGQGSSPAPYDPHVHQQFPGQFPAGSAEPYRPPNPSGAAADYYGDQGQSVAEQPGVRPTKPPVIPNSQAHLMAASPAANPPPEPSSLGQVGAAASYFDNDAEPVQSQDGPPSEPIAKPPKPGKPSKPSKPFLSNEVPAAAAAGTAAYGVSTGMTSGVPQYPSTTVQDSVSYPQPAATGTPSKPPHSHGVGTGIGVAAAGAAAGYMLGHQHDHPSRPAHSSQYTFQNFEQSSQVGLPPHVSGTGHPMMTAGAAAHAAHVAHNPGYYPHAGGALAMQHRRRGPLSKFVDFWRDPEGVGRFEDYTETIGVCKYCFDPGTSSLDAPRKHHYHHGRRHSADRYSSSSSSRVNKLSRYHSSEDERGRRRKSRKSSSWLPGVLGGYAAKSIFTGKDFDDSYSVRDRISSYDDGTYSYTSRGVVRRSGRSSPDEYYYHKKPPRRTRSRSRSSSRTDQRSFVKEAALGAAVGSATLEVSKSHQRSRSRSPSRTERRKDSSSSSSFIDVSRPVKKSNGGFASFFTSSSENRKEKRSKKSKSFFTFRSSSSSSLDADLAFGTAFAKKSKDKKKKSKAKKDEDVDAALLGLGATATALAASSHGRGRSTGQILTARDVRARPARYSLSATNDDDDWVDESEDQASSSVSSALAYGASSEDSSSDSSSRRWGWRWGSKKSKKKDKRSSATDTAAATGAGALGAAALASRARHRDSRSSSSAGSLQQVCPVSTSDPSRYDATKVSLPAMSGDQPPLVRPGAIPLQQPQPVTPVSQAVYTTQGSLPGSIPAYSTPAAVPPIFANEYDRYGPQYQAPRDVAWGQEDIGYSESRQPYISDSSTVFLAQERPVSDRKRRSTTTRDQASVSFDLTREQAERQRRLDRRDKMSRDEFPDEPVQLIDREEELAQRDFGGSAHRRKERDIFERDGDGDGESSKWVEAAAAGAIGATAASSLVSSRKPDDEETFEASSRRRERRRAERRRVSEPEANTSIVSMPQVEVPQSLDDTGSSVEHVEIQDQRPYRGGSHPVQVHDGYADFFAPQEVRHSPNEHSRRVSGDARPTIIERVPASERQKNNWMNDDPRDMPQFGPEPYENHENLPWQVPRLNIIEPTPPQSINDSVRSPASPIAPLGDIPEEPKESERPSTGSRVSWGPHETHEYEVPSSSEAEISPPPEKFQEIPVDTSGKSNSKDVSSKNDFGDDIEFAATVAAATEVAGFDPSYVIDDPKYHKRTSPPGSEDEGTFSPPRSKWDFHQDQAHGLVEGKIKTPQADKSRFTEPSVEHAAEPSLDKPNRNRADVTSIDNDVFSMPGGFDSGDKFREIADSQDDARTASSAPAERDAETSTKFRKTRRSKRDSDTFSVNDDSRSAVTSYEDWDKSGRCKYRRPSYGDDGASIVFSSAKLDDTLEKRGSKDAKDNTNSDEYRSRRQTKEEKRRQRYYEEIGESGKRRELEKDDKPSTHKDDSDKSFLAERPEMPAAAERNEHGASGLEDTIEDTSFAVSGLGMSEETLHQQPRSRSTSPPATEKALDLTRKSQSRPSSPEMARDKDESPHRRRPSMPRSATESPTAVPLHFRRPPTSPGLQRSAPDGGSPTAAASSPSSPSQPRHRRLNSVEFKNSREIRPLWLVERHGATKGEPAEEDEPLPSLPSSKTSSRAPSVEDLRTLHDEDAVKSWDTVGLSQSMGERRRPIDLTISTERANQGDGDSDLLDSQQATPTAESYGTVEESAKEEKPKYEFHSPSELLQDPSMYPDMPPSPTMEALPSAEGSMVSANGTADEAGQEAGLELQQDSVSQPEMDTPTEKQSSLNGPGFAGVVDANVAAAKEEEKELPEAAASPEDDSTVAAEPIAESSPPSDSKLGDFADVVNAPISHEVSSSDKAPADERLGEPGTTGEDQPSVQAEASKDLAPEQPSDAAQTESAKGPPVEDVATTSSSKKKKKKKGKKGQASQSVDLTSSESMPAAEAQAPTAEATEHDFAPKNVHHDTTKSEARPELGDSSKELAIEPQPAAPAIQESVDSLKAAESHPEPETTSSAAVEAGSEEAVSTPEPQAGSAESAVPTDEPAEPEQLEDTAALSKKAKRERKKQKKKAKSAAAEEEVTQPQEPLQESAELTKVDGDVATDVTQDQEDLTRVGTADTLAPVEQDTPEFHEARDTAEPPEPSSISPVEEVTKAQDEPVSLEAPGSNTRETDLTEPTPAETTEPPSVEQPPYAAEFVAPGSFPDTPPTSEKEIDEDKSHEAVDDQPVFAEEPSETPSEPYVDAGAGSAAPTESQEVKAEEKQEEQPKKKGKKKKDRKSVSFEETEVSSEPKLASEPEPEQSKEVESDQTTPVGPADTQDSPADSETQPPESEQPTPDVLEVPSEEPTDSAEHTPPVKPTEDLHETPVTQTEPEPEVPMTAAQKKKAKKEKKKKAKQQSVSSISEEEKLIESSTVEPQPKEEVSPAASEAVEPQAVETQPTEGPQPEQPQPPPAETAESVPQLASTSPETAEETPMPQEGPSADVAGSEEKEEGAADTEQPQEPAITYTAEIAIDESVAEPGQAQPEAPNEALAEEPPAEPEIPMTAAQKKKAKKAKKKQQQQQEQQEQQETQSSVPEEVQAVETASASEAAPETPPAPEAPSISQDEPSPESAEASKEVEAAPDTESGVTTEVSTPSVGLGISAPSTGLPSASEETSNPADVTSVADKPELFESKELGKDGSNQVADAGIPAPIEEVQATQDDVEVAPSEPEVQMTAAQKKKAKKEKKKQQKRQSLQQEEEPGLEPTPEPGPTPASSEQNEGEQTTEPTAEAESTGPVEEPSSGPEEAKSTDDLAPTVEYPAADAEDESKVKSTPEDESNPPAVDVESNAATGPSTADATSFSPEQPEIQPVPEEAAPESSPVDAPALNESSEDSQDPLPTKDVPATQESFKETGTLDDAATEAAASQEPATSVPVEDAVSEQAEDSALVTPKSKKDKKKKKQRRSLALEEESQLDAHPERAKEEQEEESTEPAPSETAEAPASTKSAAPAPVTPAQSTPENPSPDEGPKDESVSEQPIAEPEATADPEATAGPELEVPMTSAQRKKAKKEKKKRKSVAWDDEVVSAATPAEPKQERSAFEQSKDPNEQSLTDPVSNQESSETPGNAGEPAEKPTDNDVAESETVAVAPAPQSAEATETSSDAAEATPKTEIMAQECSETGSPKVSAGQDPEEHQAKSTDQTPDDEQPESSTEQKTPSEEPSVTTQGPAEPAEATEPVAEGALSAKERRKLKKKEKNKDKSADVGTVPTPPIEAPQETEVSTSVEPEASKTDDSQPAVPGDTEAAKVDENEPSQLVEGGVIDPQIAEDPITAEQKVEAEKVDGAETVQPAEPESVTAEPEQAAEQESTEPKAGLDAQPVAEKTEEPELAAPKDSTEQVEQKPEPELELALSAKERGKLKKKEKKRQSKSLDADDNATTADTPSTVATEPVQESTLAETAPAEPQPAAAESPAPESDKPASTENETREISESVTAPSPAEHDGKEHQSHDIEPSDAPANDLTSTDEFVSSQVEQPQIERRFSDYPPQPVLERSIDFDNSTSGDAQKEMDVESAVPEAEVPSIGEKATDDVLTEEVQKQEEGDLRDEKVKESSPEATTRVEEIPVSEEPEEEPPVEIAPEPTADAPAPQVPAVEEIVEPVSSKQKKKEKRKKQKQQEEKTEGISPAEPEPSTAEQEERSEYATSAQGITEANDDTAFGQAKESEIAPESTPLVDEPSTEPKEDAIESTEPQPSEEKTASTEAEVIANDESNLIDSETVAPETEQVEVTSMPRKLSKKEKKKQRQALVSQQLEATDKPDEQTVSGLGEASASPREATGWSASAADEEERKTGDDSVENAAQPQDVGEGLEEAAPAVAENRSEGSKEDPSTELSTEFVKDPEIEQNPEPMGDSVASTAPAEHTTEQSSGDPTVEPEEEWPTVSKKRSKKDKKRAAAAAAATLEEDKPTEPQPTLEESPVLQDSEPQEELSASNDAPQDNNDNEQHPGSPDLHAVEQSVPATSEPESKPEDIVEGPAESEPVSRKLSKKEKRKAKKQAKQEPLDLTVAPTENTPAEDVMVREPEHAETEASPVTRTTDAVESTETVPDSQPVTQESSAKVAPEPEPENSENIDAAVASEAEKLNEDAAMEQADGEDNQGAATVSLDPFDVPSPTEGEDRDAPASNDPTTRGQEEREDETEMKLRARAFEQQDDLDVARELLEDRPREAEVVAPSVKKLSKKEKRKAKKKGILEEPHPEQEQETVPEPAAEPKQMDEAIPTPQQPEKEASAVEPEPAVESEPVQESEPVPEASEEIEPATESQAAVEPEMITQTEPVDPEPIAEEPEQPLSRKASKKKEKKAKKAALALNLGAAPEDSTHQPETAVSPVQEPRNETQDVESVEPIAREHKLEDEEWPTIEWEQEQIHKSEPSQEFVPEPEPVTAVPEAQTIGDFDESTIPEALQEVKKESEEPIEEESWSMPLSKKDKKKAKKNKMKSEQAAAQAEETAPKSSQEEVELASPAPKEIEVEPPVRTTTPGGSRIASFFPGLERGGFRRSALKKDSPSLKDSAEEETAADQEANRDIAIPVSEAPLATTETEDDADSANDGEEVVTTTTGKDAPVEDVAPKDESTEEAEIPVHDERSIADEFPSPAHPDSEERSSMLFGPSPSTRTDEPSDSRDLLPSQMEAADEASSGLRRIPSIIHGRHQQTARTWSLEEPSLQALQTPSPPRSLFGGPLGEDTLSRPRTPLDPIAEQDPGDAEQATTVQSGTPRLEINPEHVLPRPVTPVQKFTDHSLPRESWPTSNDSSQDSLSKKSPVRQTPEQGGPSLKASSSKGKLRRTNRSASGDLRAVSRALDSQPPPKSDLDQLPSSSSYDPVTDKGKRPLQNMADVYEGWGETPSSPRSPSRPPSVRRRRSMQHLQDLETRLDQLISENRLLIAARDEAEDRLRKASVARRKSDQALNTRGADLRDKEAEVEQLKSSVEWFQKEMGRLTQENEELTASNAALAAAHAAEVSQVRETSTSEIDDLRSQHAELSTNMDDRVRQDIEAALAQKDAELRRLREELEDARDKVKELQQQIAASVHDNALVFRDEDYFDPACQKLCSHVQQWVLRFSKHSDHRRCRSLGDLHDEKIADRFDNSLLDGSDADAYLADRVRRRDVFMSVVMTMIWEYVFTRYLFGMDREQRQKLKSLEKQLGEVGPQRAVHRWRATTLTLLSRRPAFASQRQNDSEAVALEIFDTLSRVLPPPSQVEAQLLDSLRKVLRVAVNLSLEMRTQLAEFIMLPPLQPEYDTNGDLTRQVYFNASLMNERSGETSSNEDLESQQAIVRIVLFPLVVKKGNDVGEGDDEVVVCPAQVLVARPDKRMSKMKSGDRMSIDAARSVHSVAPSVAPSTMDTSNVI